MKPKLSEEEIKFGQALVKVKDLPVVVEAELMEPLAYDDLERKSNSKVANITDMDACDLCYVYSADATSIEIEPGDKRTICYRCKEKIGRPTKEDYVSALDYQKKSVSMILAREAGKETEEESHLEALEKMWNKMTSEARALAERK